MKKPADEQVMDVVSGGRSATARRGETYQVATDGILRRHLFSDPQDERREDTDGP